MELSLTLEIIPLLALLAPKLMSKTSNQLNVRIPEQLREQLDEVCKSTGLDISVVVRACMEAFVAAYDQDGQISLPLAVVPKSRLKQDSMPVVPAMKIPFSSTVVLPTPEDRAPSMNEEPHRDAAVPKKPITKTRATLRAIAKREPKK